MRVHHRLNVWQRSLNLAETIYRITSTFPKSEEYGLGLQLRRAAVSVPSNIAEGAARQTKREFIQFLYIASGSASEIDTQLELAGRLGYLESDRKDKVDTELDNIHQLLS